MRTDVSSVGVVNERSADVVVVGAGMAGLRAAVQPQVVEQLERGQRRRGLAVRRAEVGFQGVTVAAIGVAVRVERGHDLRDVHLPGQVQQPQPVEEPAVGEDEGAGGVASLALAGRLLEPAVKDVVAAGERRRVVSGGVVALGGGRRRAGHLRARSAASRATV